MVHHQDRPQSPNPEGTIDPHKCCSICYDLYGISEDREQSVQLACGHRFGSKCISKWIKAKGTCPLCRAPQIRFGNHYYSRSVKGNIQVGIAAPRLEHGEPGRQSTSNHWREAPALQSSSRSVPQQRSNIMSTMRPERGHLRIRRNVTRPHCAGQEDDIWLTVLHHHASTLPHATLSLSSRFGCRNANIYGDELSSDSTFEDLLNVHKRWMAEALAEDEAAGNNEHECLV
ncbi:hypothetical protein J1614_008054 [Plenodomus biglobosus]|nr:hypothetical protein J1614_008054 [Plenodomus biglobosus]